MGLAISKTGIESTRDNSTAPRMAPFCVYSTAASDDAEALSAAPCKICRVKRIHRRRLRSSGLFDADSFCRRDSIMSTRRVWSGGPSAVLASSTSRGVDNARKVEALVHRRDAKTCSSIAKTTGGSWWVPQAVRSLSRLRSFRHIPTTTRPCDEDWIDRQSFQF